MPPPGLQRTVLLTCLTLLAFAGNSILCRMALQDGSIDPVGFTAVRLSSGALALLPFLPRGAEERARTPRDPRAAAALVVYAIAFSLAYVSLDAGTGALLLFGLVQVSMIGVGLYQGERPSALRLVGIVAAVTGVVWLVLPGVSAPDPVGALLMSVAGVAWGAYSLFGRRVPVPTAATAQNFLLAAPVSLLFLLVASSQLAFSLEGVLLALASGIVTSGLGYVLWYATLPGHSATSAAVVQLAVPVIAAAGGWALLGEELSLRLVGAGALTLGGVGLALYARSQGD